VTLAPDIAGFKDAQRRLRQTTGQDITFRIPVAPVWDPAVQRDPETGDPYDPTAVPTSGGGFTNVVVRASVNFKPIRVHILDEVQDFAGGVQRTDQVALTVDTLAYPPIQDATEFVLNGVDWKITEVIPDGLQTEDRKVIFGEVK
jgi:hypothetical protein